MLNLTQHFAETQLKFTFRHFSKQGDISILLRRVSYMIKIRDIYLEYLSLPVSHFNVQ